VVVVISEFVRLAVPLPFAADAMLTFLSTHTVPGVEHVRDRTYYRSLRLPAGTGTIAVTLPPQGHPSPVEAVIRLDDPGDLVTAIAVCRRILDLNADPVAVDTALGGDHALAYSITATPGLRVPGAVDGPEMLIRAMLGQQVSVAGAQTAAARLTVAAGERLPVPVGELTHLFPSPAAIADLGPAVIAGPRRRAQAICDAAAAMADGSLVVSRERNTAELTADLVARPGIGPWTAGYVAMRLLADPDVLLTGDLVIRAGASLLGLPGRPAELTQRSSAWRPFRSYAGMHLWKVALAEAARARAEVAGKRVGRRTRRVSPVAPRTAART
jgi:AraC family transcriptional regulator of adaptative response / DNA-3-methyladenine glycosylase II